MSDKATNAHNRMQAEKAHAVNSMKAMARRHKVRCEESAAVDRYQRARIAALEIEVEELTRERDEARRIAIALQVQQQHECGAPNHLKETEWQTSRRIARERGWDCFKDDTND